jgi:hypothetical protein
MPTPTPGCSALLRSQSTCIPGRPGPSRQGGQGQPHLYCVLRPVPLMVMLVDWVSILPQSDRLKVSVQSPPNGSSHVHLRTAEGVSGKSQAACQKVRSNLSCQSARRAGFSERCTSSLSRMAAPSGECINAFPSWPNPTTLKYTCSRQARPGQARPPGAGQKSTHTMQGPSSVLVTYAVWWPLRLSRLGCSTVSPVHGYLKPRMQDELA